MRRVSLSVGLWLILTGFSAAGFGADPPKTSRVKLDASQGQVLRSLFRFDDPSEGYFPWHLEFDNPEKCTAAYEMLQKSHAKGVAVLPPYKKFLDVLFRAEKQGDRWRSTPDADAAWDALDRAGVFWRDPQGFTELPPPPPNRETQRAPSAHPEPEDIIRGPLPVNKMKLDGKGVIIAVIDTGVDFRNPEFQTEKGETRLLYFWDTFAPRPEKGLPGSAEASPVQLGANQPVGVIYTRDEINQVLSKRLPVVADLNGHGTGCATVAAGNGRLGKHAGVAPEADLIAVRIGGRTSQDCIMDNSWLLPQICAWLDQVAAREKKPVVISCSFGGQHGSHDGNRINERQLMERMPLDKAGRALCISAGNERDNLTHGELLLRNKFDDGALRWFAEKECTLTLYFNQSDAQNVQFLKADVLGGQAKHYPPEYAERARAELMIHKPSGRLMTQLQVGPGRAALRVENGGNTPLEVDAYLPEGAEFLAPCLAARKLVGTPGTTPVAITVGSYDWNALINGELNPPVERFSYRQMEIGRLSAYSSPGPSRATTDTEHRKPEIAAPGQWFTVARPRDPAKPDAKPEFTGFNGTSAAAPYTAGIIALMFQINPQLTAADIKALLRKHCQSKPDQATGKLPNDDWGYGKLRKDVVLAICEEVMAGSTKK